jgi:CBS domain-containing protein
MSTDLLLLSPGMEIHRAMNLLIEHDVSGAPVVDETGELVGLLCERDCLTVVFKASYHQEPGGKVSEFMVRDVQTIDVSMAIIEVVELFYKSRYRRFPVMSDGRLVGVLSRRDILMAVEELW